MIALVLTLALQQDAAQLAHQLGDDDVDRRDDAEKALIAMGPAALPHVRPLMTSDDPEVAVRAANIVRWIETNERRKAVRGDVQRVTAHATSFKEALKAIDPKLAEGVDDKPLAFDADNLPLWEALDKLARAHGGVDFISELTGETREIYGMKFPEHAIKLLKKPAGVKPTKYIGPYRVRVERVRSERHWIVWGQLGDSGGKVTLRIDVAPNAFPTLWEGGADLAPVAGDKTFDPFGWTAKMTYAVATETHVFEGWEAASGHEEAFGPFKATFRPENCDGANCTMSFNIAWQDDALALIGGDLRKHIEVVAVSKDGKTRVAATAKEYSSGNRKGVYFMIPHQAGVGHDRLEVKMVTDWFTEDVPFEFNDVPVPQF